MDVNVAGRVERLDVLTQDQARSLVEAGGWPRVSMFLPTVRAGRETEGGGIQLKNVLKDAEHQLEARGMRGPEVDKLLHGAQEWVGDSDFWQHQHEGLAVYASQEGMQAYKVPRTLDPLAVVGEHFALKPLLPLAAEGGAFYLLALSENHVRLFRGTVEGLTPVEPPDLPKNFSEAMQIDMDASPEHQVRTGGSPQGAGLRQPAMFHGQGTAGDKRAHKRWLFDFCRTIDHALRPEFELGRSGAPLILACVDELLPIYKEANTYKNLLERHVEGNTDHLKPHELHERAWPIARSVFAHGRDLALERYRSLAGSDQSSADVEEVILAAQEGRVDTLLLAVDERIPGRFDAKQRTVTRGASGNGSETAEDLGEQAIALAYQNGGTVYGFQREQMPGQVPLAAIFRY